MKMKSGLFGLLFRLRRDERGSILIQATLIIVVIMGMIGLALDGGRLFMAHNDLQDLADAAALAGANKLNDCFRPPGNSCAGGIRAAADTAARNVGDANNVRWWDVSAAKILSGTNGVQFYKSLADLDANNPATADKDANYIKVTTGAWEVAPTFVNAVRVFGGSPSNNPAQARAVAEAGTQLCVPASMMLCNPSDNGTTFNTDSFDAAGPKQVVPGTMFVFSTNGNTAFSPGVFSLLDEVSADGTTCGSDPCVKELLSKQSADFCTGGGTSPAQGQKNNATINGINVRFDQPSSGAGNVDSHAAPIVIDGIKPRTTGGGGVNCNQTTTVTPPGFDPSNYSATCNGTTPSTVSCPLPRDRVLTASGGTGSAFVGGANSGAPITLLIGRRI
jgi:hypothetical protein